MIARLGSSFAFFETNLDIFGGDSGHPESYASYALAALRHGGRTLPWDPRYEQQSLPQILGDELRCF